MGVGQVGEIYCQVSLQSNKNNAYEGGVEDGVQITIMEDCMDCKYYA